MKPIMNRMNSPERNGVDRPGDMDDDLDRILQEQDLLLPTSGFAGSVMDAIQQQAAAPPPIPFPWKWALPGIAALLAGIVILCRLAVNTFQSMGQSSAGDTDWLAWLLSSTPPAVLLRTEVAPALLALAASFACVALCRGLAGGWTAR
jgi:hypothetical protein